MTSECGDVIVWCGVEGPVARAVTRRSLPFFFMLDAGEGRRCFLVWSRLVLDLMTVDNKKECGYLGINCRSGCPIPNSIIDHDGINSIAWSFDFPSHSKQLRVWRTTTTAITGIPASNETQPFLTHPYCLWQSRRCNGRLSTTNNIILHVLLVNHIHETKDDGREGGICTSKAYSGLSRSIGTEIVEYEMQGDKRVSIQEFPILVDTKQISPDLGKHLGRRLGRIAKLGRARCLPYPRAISTVRRAYCR